MDTNSALRTYEPIGKVYDAYAARDNYQRYVAILDELVRSHGDPGRRLLDIACGTGKATVEFAARGYEVSGCDLSPAMLASARAKDGVRGRCFFEADMRTMRTDLPLFDVVTCLDDALNHLLDPGDLQSAFRAAARVARPGGLYIFDLNNLFAYRTWYAQHEAWSCGDLFFVWRGCASQAFGTGQLARAELSVFEPDGSLWRRTDSPWVQRHYPPDTVRDFLRDSGFGAVHSYGISQDGQLHSPVDEVTHNKVIFVAQR